MEGVTHAPRSSPSRPRPPGCCCRLAARLRRAVVERGSATVTPPAAPRVGMPWATRHRGADQGLTHARPRQQGAQPADHPVGAAHDQHQSGPRAEPTHPRRRFIPDQFGFDHHGDQDRRQGGRLDDAHQVEHMPPHTVPVGAVVVSEPPAGRSRAPRGQGRPRSTSDATRARRYWHSWSTSGMRSRGGHEAVGPTSCPSTGRQQADPDAPAAFRIRRFVRQSRATDSRNGQSRGHARLAAQLLREVGLGRWPSVGRRGRHQRGGGATPSHAGGPDSTSST